MQYAPEDNITETIDLFSAVHYNTKSAELGIFSQNFFQLFMFFSRNNNMPNTSIK